MTNIIKKNKTINIVLSSEYEKEKFKENGIKSINFIPNKHYDILKDNNSLYNSFRLGNEFGFGKVTKVESDGQVLYKDKNKETQESFGYLEILKTYNKPFMSDYKRIEDLIYNLENNKDLFPEIFSRKDEITIEQYRITYIDILNKYLNIIDSDMTSYEKQSFIFSQKTDIDDVFFKQDSFSSITRDIESFLTYNEELNETLLSKFENVIEDLDNNLDLEI